MAKKKGIKGRKGRKGKKRGHGPKAKPLGLAAGVGLSGGDMLFLPNSVGSGPVTYLIGAIKAGVPLNDALTATFVRAQAAAVDFNKYKYAVGGMLLTASPRIPAVKMVAGPADRGLKRLTKGKWGL